MPYRNSEFVEEKKKERFKGFQPNSYLYYMWVILSWIPTCFIRLFKADRLRGMRNHVFAWITIYPIISGVLATFVPRDILSLSIVPLIILFVTLVIVVPMNLTDHDEDFLYLIERKK